MLILVLTLILLVIGFLLQKYIYKFRYSVLLFTLFLSMGLYITLYTNYRTQFNIVDYHSETYAIIKLLEGKAYMVRAKIDTTYDDNNPILYLSGHDSEIVNVFENDILGDNIVKFSKVVIQR